MEKLRGLVDGHVGRFSKDAKQAWKKQWEKEARRCGRPPQARPGR